MNVFQFNDFQVEGSGRSKDLEPDTWLWRYMSLSKFMLLAKGKVFVPSVKKHQERAPKEINIPKHSGFEFSVLPCSTTAALPLP